MKKLLLAFISILSIAAFAGQMSAAKLAKVNAYIKSLTGATAPDFVVSITSANINDTSRLLDAIAVTITNAYDPLTASLQLVTSGQQMKLSADVQLVPEDFGLDQYFIENILINVPDVLKEINNKGLYSANMAMSAEPKGTLVELVLTPTKANQKPSLKKLSLKIDIPSNLAKTARLAIVGTINSNAGNVVIMQRALTNIIEDLSDSKEPREKDLDAISTVLQEIFDVF